MFRPQVIDRLDYNGIINGDFDYWQRGTSWNPTLTGVIYGGPDRFFTSKNIGNFTVTRETDVPTYSQSNHKSSYSLKVYENTGSSLSTSSYCILGQYLEGNFFKPYIGKDVYYSFWVKSNVVATFSVLLYTSTVGTTYTYIAPYTIDQADTWEHKIVKLSIPSNLAWQTGTAGAVSVGWALGTGSNFQGPANVWNNANYHAPTGSTTNLFSSAGNYIMFSQAKFGINYVGTTLDEMIYSYAAKNIFEELNLCKRYYQVFESHIGLFSVSAYCRTDINFPIEMRVAPTCVVDSYSNGGQPFTSSGFTSTLTYKTLFSVTGTGNVYYDMYGHADAEL